MDVLGPRRRLELYTRALRAAASRCRDELSAVALPTPQHRIGLLASAARMVAKQYIPEARRLRNCAPYVRRFLVIKDNVASIVTPVAFEKAMQELTLQSCTQTRPVVSLLLG